jgi:hypothetical protein
MLEIHLNTLQKFSPYLIENSLEKQFMVAIIVFLPRAKLSPQMNGVMSR